MNKNTFHFSFNLRNSIIIMMLFICACAFAKAQEAQQFSMKLKLTVKDGNTKNALISITKNGAPFRVIDPNGGKYNVDLDLGAEYLFTCTKMGFITKSVVVDTHVPDGREKEDFAQFTATIELTKQPEEQIITYSQPVGRIKYSVTAGDFDYDNDYTATAQEMQKKAEASPIPKPKPPAPNPRPSSPPVPEQTLPPSKPIPVEVKQPEYHPEPPKPKPPVVVPDPPRKPVVRNREEKIIQEDRKKVTIVTINIDGKDYVYKMEEYAWGGVYFYKDGKYITERMFSTDTQ
jgi:hypothetical protein